MGMGGGTGTYFLIFRLFDSENKVLLTCLLPLFLLADPAAAPTANPLAFARAAIPATAKIVPAVAVKTIVPDAAGTRALIATNRTHDTNRFI